MADLDFTGKVAIVTGASRGIGRVIAVGLAKRGASVVGTARSLDSSPGAGGTLKGTVDAIEKLGGYCLPVPADITDPAGAQSVVDRAVAEFGRVDILVNNAGVYPEGTIAEFSPDEWRDLMAINLTAPFLMAHGVLPAMMDQGTGNIMNVSSGAGQTYSAGRVPYSASKAALDRFSINLAEEVREHGIAVNAWAPGLVRTDMNANNPDGAEPEVVEESAVWICAQTVESFTGQLVRRGEFGKTWGNL